MKSRIKKKLEEMANIMAKRKTDIKEFRQTTTGSRDYKGSKLKRASLSTFLFKGGFKPVNNLRTLKKAYKKGGMKLAMETAIHYQ